MVEYWKQRADAEATEDEGERLHEARHGSAATTLDGMVDLRALFDPVGGATSLSELERLMEQLRLQDLADGTVRTAGQRRADALVEMAKRSRTAADGGLRPRPLITVLVGEETLARVCELATGTVVAPGQVVPLLSDADLERVVFDSPDRVISVSRSAPSPVRYGEPSKCGTGAVSTPPGATNQPPAATSTTSNPTAKAARPPKRTGSSAAGPTTATTTSATPNHQTKLTIGHHRSPPPDVGGVVRQRRHGRPGLIGT